MLEGNDSKLEGFFFLRCTLKTPPPVKSSRRFILARRREREKEMNGERNAEDKRELSAGEWECCRDHCSSPARLDRGWM